MIMKDFKEIKGKPYYEYIKDLVKDINILF